MPEALTHIIREATQVHRLADAINRFVNTQVAAHSYPIGSTTLLRYIQGLASTTIAALQQDVDDCRENPHIHHNQPTDTIKDLSIAWSKTFHSQVKPLADATGLCVPMPLVRFLCDQLQSLPSSEDVQIRFQDTQLAIELAADLNYFHRRHGNLYQVARNLEWSLMDLEHDPVCVDDHDCLTELQQLDHPTGQTVPPNLRKSLSKHLIPLSERATIEIRDQEKFWQHWKIYDPPNYYALRPLGDAVVISKTPPILPNGLGMLGLPYSQSTALFTNCLLFHEAGHFVIERLNLSRQFDDALKPYLNKHFKKQVSQATHQLAASHMGAIARRWCQELFCDLFAVRMLGPVYTYVSADHFHMIGDLKDDEAPLFNSSHPSVSLRLKEQLLLLDELQWSEHPPLKLSEDPPLLQAINRVANLDTPNDPYARTMQGNSAELVHNVFLQNSVLDTVRGLVKKATANQGNPDTDYSTRCMQISSCLAHGIVPSALWGEAQPTNSAIVTLINAAYSFQLLETRKLFEIAPGLDADTITDQAHVAQRIEEWTLKAIEDLLDAEKGGA